MHSDALKRPQGTARFRALGFLARFLLYAALSAAATVHWEAIVSQARIFTSWTWGGVPSSASGTFLKGVWKGPVPATGSAQSLQSEASVRKNGSSTFTGSGIGVLESVTAQLALTARVSLGAELDDASLFQLVADGERARLAEETGSKGRAGEGEHKEEGVKGNGLEKGKDKIAFLFVTPSSLPLAKLWCQFFFGHDSLYSIYVESENKDSDLSQELPSCFLGSVIRSKVSYRA